MRVEKDASKLNGVHRLVAEGDVRGDDVVRFARGDHQVNTVERVCNRDVVKGDPEKCYRQPGRFAHHRWSSRREQRRLSVAGDNGCGGNLLVGPHTASERASASAWNGDST